MMRLAYGGEMVVFRIGDGFDVPAIPQDLDFQVEIAAALKHAPSQFASLSQAVVRQLGWLAPAVAPKKTERKSLIAVHPRRPAVPEIRRREPRNAYGYELVTDVLRY